MIDDRPSLHLALFAAVLAVALLTWVEISLGGMERGDAPRATAKTVAPGLSIAVHGATQGATPAPLRNVALNSDAR